MVVHHLKTEPQYLQAHFDGLKDFEIRFNDRDYKVGDELDLFGWENNTETGLRILRKIKYIHSGLGLKDGYVILRSEPITKKLKASA